MRHGFFVAEGMACAATVMKDGTTAAADLIGREGFVGLSLLFGGVRMQPATVIVKIPGKAMKIDANVFLREFEKRGLFRDIMRQYSFSRMASLMQSAACNSVHCIRERMACCLLRTADRVGADFKLTHEAIAQLLGNRRATVSTQLESFRRLGLISSRYGQISIENRRGLEEVACECYQVHQESIESVFELAS